MKYKYNYYFYKNFPFNRMLQENQHLFDSQQLHLKLAGEISLRACGYTFCNNTEITIKNFNNKQISKEQELMNKILQTYEKHKIDQSYKHVQEFKKLGFQPGSELQQIIELVQEEYGWIKEFQKQLDPAGWVVQKEKDNITTSTKYQGNTVGVLSETEINVPIQIFLTVITDFDRMLKIMPFMEKSKLVKEHRRNIKIGYTLNNFPILSERQALFDGYGFDRLDHNDTVFLFARSIHNKQALLKRYGIDFKQNKDYIQAEFKYLILQYQPIDKMKGKLKLAVNTDLKISIPMFILGSLSQNFGIQLLNNILKIGKDFEGSEWEQQMKKNPQFYKFLENRVKQYQQSKVQQITKIC